MATKDVVYSVIITFDLNYAERSDYKLINSYLNSIKYLSLSDSYGISMPSNTYIGEVLSEITYEGRFTLEILKQEADRLRTNLANSLRNVMRNSGIMSTLYVRVSASEATSSRKSST